MQVGLTYAGRHAACPPLSVKSPLLFTVTRKIKIFERCDLSAEGWPVAGLAQGAGAGMGGVSGTRLRVLRAACLRTVPPTGGPFTGIFLMMIHDAVSSDCESWSGCPPPRIPRVAASISIPGSAAIINVIRA